MPPKSDPLTATPSVCDEQSYSIYINYTIITQLHTAALDCLASAQQMVRIRRYQIHVAGLKLTLVCFCWLPSRRTCKL